MLKEVLRLCLTTKPIMVKLENAHYTKFTKHFNGGMFRSFTVIHIKMVASP